jgi:hypothetical protein
VVAEQLAGQPHRVVVRGVLVPSALALLGERSWSLPRWLAWLPGRPLDQVAVPSPAAQAPAPAGRPLR